LHIRLSEPGQASLKSSPVAQTLDDAEQGQDDGDNDHQADDVDNAPHQNSPLGPTEKGNVAARA
jgi:hypothetical protein